LYRASLEHRGRPHHLGEPGQGHAQGHASRAGQGGGKTPVRRKASPKAGPTAGGRRASENPEHHRQGKTMKICVAGQGAGGPKDLDALKRIPGVEVSSLGGGSPDTAAEVAKKYGIAHHTCDLGEGIARADAVILTTPT